MRWKILSVVFFGFVIIGSISMFNYVTDIRREAVNAIVLESRAIVLNV